MCIHACMSMNKVLLFNPDLNVSASSLLASSSMACSKTSAAAGPDRTVRKAVYSAKSPGNSPPAKAAPF